MLFWSDGFLLPQKCFSRQGGMPKILEQFPLESSPESLSMKSWYINTPAPLPLGRITEACVSGVSDSKKSAWSMGDPGLILGSGISSGEGNGDLLQYSCLENAMDRGAWQATQSMGVTKSWASLRD